MLERPEKVVAQTRLRGELEFYDAVWVECEKCRGGFAVKFIKGPHKGEKFESAFVAKRSK